MKLSDIIEVKNQTNIFGQKTGKFIAKGFGQWFIAETSDEAIKGLIDYVETIVKNNSKNLRYFLSDNKDVVFVQHFQFGSPAYDIVRLKNIGVENSFCMIGGFDTQKDCIKALEEHMRYQ